MTFRISRMREPREYCLTLARTLLMLWKRTTEELYTLISVRVS